MKLYRAPGTLLFLALLCLAAPPPQGFSAAASANEGRVSGGVFHTCSLTATGGVLCWGQGRRLGLPEDAEDRTAPVPVAGLTGGVQALAAGNNHTCALTAAGGVLCWSDNTFGELGDGTTMFRALPTAASGLASGVVAIGAGSDNTCAVLLNGGVKCWGANDSGELGDGTTTERHAPVEVTKLPGAATAVTSRNGHTCALLVDGGVACWGRGLEGELGDGTKNSSPRPVSVSRLAGAAGAVATGSLHTCAMLASGGVQCWGQDDSGELGDAAFSGNDRLTPVAVVGLRAPAVAITAGDAHTCVLNTAGGVQCWGSNDAGQLGDGTTQARSTPVDVLGLQSGVVAIGAGQEHTCALLLSGAITCWGDNSEGQLGDGTLTQQPTPVSVLFRTWLPLVVR